METKGNCYQAAADLLLFLGIKQSTDGYFLVHGEVTGQGKVAGVRFGHAWVEDDQTVYDYSNGRNIKMPKILYYAIGNIDERKVYKYTRDEAIDKMVKSGHYGPWDLVTSTGL